MEVTSTSQAQDWQRVADTLAWAEEHLLQPRVNCLETWFQHSREDLSLMRATTTLSLTHSNGYCLFSDPNPLPVPDHLHNWYPFWDKEIEAGRLKLGKPVASRVVWEDGVVTRLFQYGMVAYNPKGNGPVTLMLAKPTISTATGKAANKHVLDDEDGDIYVSLWPSGADLNHDGHVTLVDFARFAESFGAAGVRVEDPRELPEALDRALALAQSRPVIVDVVSYSRYTIPSIEELLAYG